jgi:hypothetical protein
MNWELVGQPALVQQSPSSDMHGIVEIILCVTKVFYARYTREDPYCVIFHLYFFYVQRIDVCLYYITSCDNKIDLVCSS